MSASLAKLAPRTTVTVSDGEGGTETFSVRGLSLVDIRELMTEEGGDAIPALYSRIVSSMSLADGTALGEAIGDLLDNLPELCAKVIARGLGLPDAWEQILEANAGAQWDLLEGVYRQTFASERATKKVWEVVSRYAKARLESPPSDLKTGSGV